MRARGKTPSRFVATYCMVSLLISSCSLGQQPPVMVQICVQDGGGLELFRRTVQSIARDENMRYVDRSGTSEKELQRLDALDRPGGTLVNVGVIGDHGHGLGAGNLGLNTYDIAVGFSHGRDLEAGVEFSNRVIARLEQHWTVEPVPKDSGALPDPDCAQALATPPNHSFTPTPSARLEPRLL